MPVKANDPTQVATDWANRLGQSGAKIQRGVEAVTVSPGQAAARNVQGYVSGVQNNVQKWQRNVSAVTLNEWQTDMINKGIPRIASGAQNAEPKFANFMGKLLTAERNLYGSLPARGTTDQNIARAVAWMQGMAKLRGSF